MCAVITTNIPGLVSALLSLVVAAPTVGRPAVASGGVIHVGTVLPTDARGAVAAGDSAAQTRRALQNLGKVLAAHGSSLGQVAQLMVTVRTAEDLVGVDRAFRAAWPKAPPVRLVIVANPPLPEARVSLAGIALARGQPRVEVQPAGRPRPAGPWSYGIRSGDVMFLGGFPGPQGGGDVGGQVDAAITTASAVLEAGGMALTDLVSARVSITDAGAFEPMNVAYRGHLSRALPTRATVVAQLPDPAQRVALLFTAVRGGDRRVVEPPTGGAPTSPNYSPGLRVGRSLFVSGFTGSGPKGDGPRDIRGQIQFALAANQRVLSAAGAGLDDVTETLVFVTESRFAANVAEVFRTAFPRDPPAVSIVETRLVTPQALVEIMVTAAGR
jgi:enamine deaminase RidA (YjgF/YER057c/UK114 family)